MVRDEAVRLGLGDRGCARLRIAHQTDAVCVFGEPGVDEGQDRSQGGRHDAKGDRHGALSRKRGPG